MSDSEVPGDGVETAFNRQDHHKHMDFVQSVIARLAGNSFVMKGWALTVTSAILGFAVSIDRAALALVALVPAVAFWILDTYYLRQERAFREMFADVAAKRLAGFEMNPRPYAERQSWWRVGKSMSLSVFYGSLVVVCALVVLALAIAPSVGEGTAGSCESGVRPSSTAPCTLRELRGGGASE